MTTTPNQLFPTDTTWDTCPNCANLAWEAKRKPPPPIRPNGHIWENRYGAEYTYNCPCGNNWIAYQTKPLDTCTRKH